MGRDAAKTQGGDKQAAGRATRQVPRESTERRDSGGPESLRR